MVKRCIVGGCSNTTREGVSLHSFPTNPVSRKQWIKQIRMTRKDWTEPTSDRRDSQVVCSDHFREDDLDPAYKIKQSLGIKTIRRLLPSAVPSVFSYQVTQSTRTQDQQKSRVTAGLSTRNPRGAFQKRERARDVSVANYACHVCNAMFTRGGVLTKHLKKKHKFYWPPGHSRFRYKRHEDGIWRLQTVRYESSVLTSKGAKDMTDEQGSANDNLNSDSAHADATCLGAENTENMDHSSAGENIAVTTAADSNQINVYMDTDEIVDSQIQLSVSGSNVAIFTNSEGASHVILTPDQSNEVNGSQMIEGYEDNMAYNLQMLGEVALLGPNR